MRKTKSAQFSIIATAIILIIGSFFSGSCSRNNSASSKDVIEIGEKMFATYVNDVYMNAQDYLGKTIKLEGIFKSEHSSWQDKTYCFVVRYGPGGCCGMDANVGFEVAWTKEKGAYPADDSWVEAAGELKYYTEDGPAKYLYLDLSSLDVLPWRGNETVYQ